MIFFHEISRHIDDVNWRNSHFYSYKFCGSFYIHNTKEVCSSSVNILFAGEKISMVKAIKLLVTKSFSYSFNVFHVSQLCVEGGTGKVSDWISGVEYFKWKHFLYEFLLCKEYLFIWKNIFDKVLKLGGKKPLSHYKVGKHSKFEPNCRRILVKEFNGINFNISSC